MIGAIICGGLIMFYVACLIIVRALRSSTRTRDRLDSRAPQMPQPRPWTVRPVSTPMLAEYGVPELFHIYDGAGVHMCGENYCYLTQTEAEAAARLGEQFTAVVSDAVSGSAW